MGLVDGAQVSILFLKFLVVIKDMQFEVREFCGSDQEIICDFSDFHNTAVNNHFFITLGVTAEIWLHLGI